ncbi:MAG: HD domain-containing protein, partial [Trueperaceae bacterium]
VFPMIVHQKLSAFIASEVFGVRLPEILSAIGCHTTLKSGASRLDKVVFVADKLAWDGQGDPPYLNQVISGLDESLELGVFRYLDHLWCRRHELRVIHPWLKAAHAELLSALSR